MIIVPYGGGTNSTAMLIGMVGRGIISDRIIFCDTGGERPDTYEFIERFSEWLVANGAPKIIKLHYTTADGTALTLEQDCLTRHCLPAIAYGYKSCSEKYKTRVTNKFCNNDPDCRAVWESGGRVEKYIGYDAGEIKRIERNRDFSQRDKKYVTKFPLYEWGWDRSRCVQEIQSAGLPLPGKSSCFFCPSMKKPEIKDLWENYPELFQRAVAIEANAAGTLDKIKGLGRNYSWTDFYREKLSEPEQLSLFDCEE